MDVNKPKIYVTRLIPKEGLEILTKIGDVSIWEGNMPVPREVLEKEVIKADALISLVTDPIDAELMDMAPNLKVIANYAVGYDNIDVFAAAQRGITVTNTPDVLTHATADLTWALILACARRVVESERFMRNGMWKAWTPTLMVGKDVYGATLGLIGFGRIGQAVAKRAIGFDMKVMYFDSQRNPDAEKQTGAQYAPLEGLLTESDFVSVHLPLSDRTRHMIGKAEFSAMKRDAIFINTARGAVVNEAELIEALQSGVIGGAGLDVYEQEPLPLDSNLFQLANVVMVPHIGSASLAARRKMAIVAAINVEAVLSGKEPVDPVLP
jgi:glyoxylate reductase